MSNYARSASPISAAVYCALLALVVGYGLSYLLTVFGLGIVSAPAGSPRHGPTVLRHAGLNLYAAQRVTLAGEGVTATASGGGSVRAQVTLPLTVWVLVPVAAIAFAGFMSARSRAGRGRAGMIGPAAAGGMLYAVALALLSPHAEARISSSVLPTVDAVSFNPPDILFSPHAFSTLALGAVFGVVFAYLGALIAVRGEPFEEGRGRWWVCGKSSIGAALAMQLLIASALLVWFVHSPVSEQGDGPTICRFAEMLPTAAGTGYALVHGASLIAGMESAYSGGRPMRPLYAQVNLYGGVVRQDDRETTRRPISPYVYILSLLAAVAVMVSGRLAVGWGSRDGSLPTGARIAIVHTAYLAWVVWLCRVGWSGAEAGFARSSVFILPAFGWWLAASAASVFVLAVIGAHWANRSYSGSPAGFHYA